MYRVYLDAHIHKELEKSGVYKTPEITIKLDGAELGEYPIYFDANIAIEGDEIILKSPTDREKIEVIGLAERVSDFYNKRGRPLSKEEESEYILFKSGRTAIVREGTIYAERKSPGFIMDFRLFKSGWMLL